MGVRIKVVFRGIGLQWPLRHGDTIEFWSDDHERVGTMEAEVVVTLLTLLHHFAADVRRPLALAPTRAKIAPAVQAERAAKRARRRKA